jgi:WD40 repeat protein
MEDRLKQLTLTNRFIGHTRSVRTIFADPLHLFYITVSDDSTMKLWHAGSCSLMFTFKGHLDVISGIAVSPDRTLLASVSLDKTIRLWSLSDGSCLDMIADASLAPFNCIAISPCGSFMAVGSVRSRVLLWGIPSPVRRRPPFIRSVQVRSAVHSLSFSPGGQYLAVGLGGPGGLAVFPIVRGAPTYVALADDCDFSAFHPNCPMLLFAGSTRD